MKTAPGGVCECVCVDDNSPVSCTLDVEIKEKYECMGSRPIITQTFDYATVQD